MRDAYLEQLKEVFGSREQFLDYQASPLAKKLEILDEKIRYADRKGFGKNRTILLLALQGLTVTWLHQSGVEIALSPLQHDLFLDQVDDETSNEAIEDDPDFSVERAFFYRVRADESSGKGLLRVTVRVGGETEEIDPVGVSYDAGTFTYVIWQTDLAKIYDLGFRDDGHFERAVLPFLNARARKVQSADGLINGQGKARLNLPKGEEVIEFPYDIREHADGTVRLVIDKHPVSELLTEYKGEEMFVIVKTDHRVGERLGFVKPFPFSCVVGRVLQKVEGLLGDNGRAFPFAHGGHIEGRFSIPKSFLVSNATARDELDLDRVEMVELAIPPDDTGAHPKWEEGDGRNKFAYELKSNQLNVDFNLQRVGCTEMLSVASLFLDAKKKIFLVVGTEIDAIQKLGFRDISHFLDSVKSMLDLNAELEIKEGGDGSDIDRNGIFFLDAADLLDPPEEGEDDDIVHYEVTHQVKDMYWLHLRKHMTNDSVHVADLELVEDGFAVREIYETDAGTHLAVDALNQNLKQKDIPEAVKTWRGTFRMPKSEAA